MHLKSNNYSIDLKLRVVDAFLDKIYSISDIVKIFNVSKSSVYNWVNLFKSNQLNPKCEYTKQFSNFRNPQIRNTISEYIKTNSNFIYSKLIAHIFDTNNISIKKSTLYNIINDLGFSKKVANFKKVYTKTNKTLKTKTIDLSIKVKTISNNKIVSIDEVSFDTNIIHKYGWSQKNSPIIKQIGATYKRLTMICAITNKKVIHYDILNGSANAEHFKKFIKNIPNVKNKYLFLDNARIHHSKIVQEYVTNNKLNFLFNVPYSPEFNPIEFMFSKLKRNIRNYSNNDQLSTLISNIKSSINKVTSCDLTNYFKHSFDTLRNYLKK